MDVTWGGIHAGKLANGVSEANKRVSRNQIKRQANKGRLGVDSPFVLCSRQAQHERELFIESQTASQGSINSSIMTMHNS